MCIILHADNSDAAARLRNDRALIAEAWAENPDGAGFIARAADGHLIAGKGYMSLPALLAAIDRLPRRLSELAIHCRIATHGGVRPSLTHPFAARWGYLLHNGVFRGIDGAIRPGESDTAAVARLVGRMSLDDALAVLRALDGGRVLVVTPYRGSFRLGPWEHSGGLWFSHPMRRHFAIGRWIGVDDTTE